MVKNSPHAGVFDVIGPKRGEICNDNWSCSKDLVTVQKFNQPFASFERK